MEKQELNQHQKNEYLNGVAAGESKYPASKLIKALSEPERLLTKSRGNISVFKTRIGRILSWSTQMGQPFVVGHYYVSPTTGGLYNVQYKNRGIGTLSRDQVAKRISQDFVLFLMDNPN